MQKLHRRFAVGCLTATLSLSGAAGALLLFAGASRAATAVSVYPIAGARYEAPATQIAFRGVAPGAIGSVSVVGSKSGAHLGTIAPDSDGQGGSFIPATPFTSGEKVTVTTALNVVGGTGGVFSFTIVHPANLQKFPPLPQVPVGSNGLQHFRSRPDLTPAALTVTQNSAPASPGDIFVAPQFGPTQDGPMILDRLGRLVWFHPTPIGSRLLSTDFRVQSLFGQPVLTWWQGHTVSGSGSGAGYIYNRYYQQQYVVHAADGLGMDLHEFLLTNSGQAYLIAVSPIRVAGDRRPLVDAVVQEIDIKTGLVLFEWHALDRISLQESSQVGPHIGGHIVDPFHVNSVGLDRDGNLIVSARNTSAVYKLDRSTGQIIWRLGGKKSSFKMGSGTTTAFQHDARVQPDGTITIFDDGAGPPKVHPSSRGIRVALDLKHMTASLVKAYNHSPNISAIFEGSTQSLPGGDVFLGWGQQPYFSENNASGKQDFDAHFNEPTASYRAYRFPWNAQPPTTPALAIKPNPDGTMQLYASWNGATTVASWRLLSGSSSQSLQVLGSAPTHGFETSIKLHSGNPSFGVQAVGHSGTTLASSGARGAPQRTAIYARSAFVSPAALAGIPVGCFAVKACRIVITVNSGRTVLARSGTQTLGANTSGILYFRLSGAGRSMLAHARSQRLPVSVTARDSLGFQSTVTINLVPFSTSGPGPHRDASQSGGLRLLGQTAFVRSDNRVGGILTACDSASACLATTTITVGNTVVAHTGREYEGPKQAGYLTFSLTAAGASMLAHAGGHQLGAHVKITGSSTASGDIALVPFR
ncbi:MAG: arylsulfotransferase family protein [Actinomycetota bacterium]|nr:arylsulfotransferase family protein [Actinomycetota bacterium]